MSITTQTLQGTVLSITSNVLAQAIKSYQSNSPFSLSLPQVSKFALFSILSGPPNILWQSFLEEKFPTNVRTRTSAASSAEKEKKRDPTTTTITTTTTLSKTNVLIKFLLDQTIGAIINTILFIAYMSFVNNTQAAAQGQLGHGGAWDAVKRDCAAKTWPMMKDGYKFWPLISLVSFLWVPVERRMVFGCSVGVVWGIYLSLAVG
ncbi:hypothetical protein NX059_008404 [Plenodomus lindquistii]|nr:hypothetical protein NX059_008404 [Plenodomus lindquistii]